MRQHINPCLSLIETNFFMLPANLAMIPANLAKRNISAIRRHLSTGWPHPALLFTMLFILILPACNPFVEEGVRKKDLEKDVELNTDFGTVVFRLSDDTPLHRNNFIRLVNEGFYDGLSFHRVIDAFLIQTGDPNTRPDAAAEAPLPVELPYTVPAEFTPDLFHKRGAINAARSDNPERASSSTQFTIIQGRVYNDSTLAVAEGRINGWLADNRLRNDPEYNELIRIRDELIGVDADSESLETVLEMIRQMQQADLDTHPQYRIPEAHRQVYKTIGGAAHLDQNYTVFGEVISGMEVVDLIAGVPTDARERPLEDVRITRARMVKRK